MGHVDIDDGGLLLLLLFLLSGSELLAVQVDSVLAFGLGALNDKLLAVSEEVVLGDGGSLEEVSWFVLLGLSGSLLVAGVALGLVTVVVTNAGALVAAIEVDGFGDIEASLKLLLFGCPLGFPLLLLGGAFAGVEKLARVHAAGQFGQCVDGLAFSFDGLLHHTVSFGLSSRWSNFVGQLTI